jgi:bacterioferritin
MNCWWWSLIGFGVGVAIAHVLGYVAVLVDWTKKRLGGLRATFTLNPAETNELVAMLNRALADEWYAFYQYWIGANVVNGELVASVKAELQEHAEEEYEHAGMLVERIRELGGVPLLDPAEWAIVSNCGYHAPRDYETKPVLEQNIQGEICAISAYTSILEFLKGRDTATERIVTFILAQEEEHKRDLIGLLNKLGK